jgi:hypothetical protein
MMLTKISLAAMLLMNVAAPALAQTVSAPGTPASALAAAQADAPFPEAWFEIFRLAAGKQEEFVRRIAQADEVSKAGGQPPIQLFFHSEGAEWDVLLFKPVTGDKPTAAQEAAMAAKSKELRLPSGPAYFLYIRELVASHTDTKAYGPVSAAQWLAKLDKWRVENAAPRKDAK